MLLILPVGAYLSFYLILREKSTDWRRAILAASVFWGLCLLVITEAVSLPGALSRGPVALCWLAICVVGFSCLTILKRHGQKHPSVPGPAGQSLKRGEKGLLIAVSGIVVLVGITALAAPPNVWDAMDYHLPRVMIWMSNHSVRFFPTPDYNQLIFGTWSEYAILHTYLL